MEFILLINAKMTTIVYILIFIILILTNTTSENYKARKSLFFNRFSLYEQLELLPQLSLVLEKFYNPGS